jgi:hypothetical protein
VVAPAAQDTLLCWNLAPPPLDSRNRGGLK